VRVDVRRRVQVTSEVGSIETEHSGTTHFSVRHDIHKREKEKDPEKYKIIEIFRVHRQGVWRLADCV